MSYKLQSVLLNKHKYSLQDAVNFLSRNNMKHKKVDITENLYRFRQVAPSTLKKEGFTKYVSKPIAEGITFVIAYKEN